MVDDPKQTGSDFGPALQADPSGQGRPRRIREGFDVDRRAMEVQMIRETVNKHEYEVDCRKVAEAIVRRLLDGRANGKRPR